MKPILVTSYVNPDLDGVAGAMAYAEFLNKSARNVTAGIIGAPHAEARYVLDRFGIPYPQRLDDATGFDEIILVDASEESALEGKVPLVKVIEIIDHRKLQESEKFPNAKAQIEFVGAAATLIAEKFMQDDVPPSRESAILLFTAIISNTLNFKGIVTDRDKAAATWANRTAQLPEDFWRELFLAKSGLSGAKLRERIEGDLATFVLGGKKVAIGQIEMIGAEELARARQDEIEHVLATVKEKMDLDITFLNLIEIEQGYNILIAPDANVQDILKKALQTAFVGNLARTDRIIMRKEIGPLIKEELDKK
jgi:manganese-dependent inorganic pyrophosphatase